MNDPQTMARGSNRWDAEPELVSIGVPVRNGAQGLERALGDLLCQTHRSIEVIISDNASTDETEAICRRFCELDPRVAFHRQDENMGPAANFRYVLGKAHGRYFMWAAADDRWEPRFIESNLKKLQDDPSIVGSISRIRWIRDGIADGLAPGTFSLMGTPRQNIRNYLRFARDNSRFYGLYDREVLMSALPPVDFYALDIATMIGTLLVGKHAEVDEVLMARRRKDPASYIDYFAPSGGSPIRDNLPLAAFTRHVLRELRIPLTGTTLFVLAARNLHEHLRYEASKRTTYGRLCSAVLRQLEPAKRRITGAGGGELQSIT